MYARIADEIERRLSNRYNDKEVMLNIVKRPDYLEIFAQIPSQREVISFKCYNIDTVDDLAKIITNTVQEIVKTRKENQ